MRARQASTMSTGEKSRAAMPLERRASGRPARSAVMGGPSAKLAEGAILVRARTGCQWPRPKAGPKEPHLVLSIGAPGPGPRREDGVFTLSPRFEEAETAHAHSPAKDHKASGRQPLRNRHPRLPRRQRARHRRRSRSTPRRTSSRCTASRPTRPTRSAQGTGADRGLSVDRRDHPRRARGQASTRSIPGYGLLSESPEFADACAAAGIIFIGPPPETMRRLGNKVSARNLADVGRRAGGAGDRAAARRHRRRAKQLAAEIGYPVMLKASWGGGGRGMRVDRRRRRRSIARCRPAKREAKAAFGKDEVYLEKLVERARHVEVQMLGDTHGNVVHLFERDCSVQRRNQKVVERAPAPYLDDEQRARTCASCAEASAAAADYVGAGTVEFLHGCRHRRSSISSRSIRASRSSTR